MTTIKKRFPARKSRNYKEEKTWKNKFKEFQKKALDGNGVQNDAANVWVEVDGKQYTVDISDVLDHEETEPFEASDALESDLDADAWEELYRQYLGEWFQKEKGRLFSRLFFVYFCYQLVIILYAILLPVCYQSVIVLFSKCNIDKIRLG